MYNFNVVAGLLFFFPRILQTVVGHHGAKSHQRSNKLNSRETFGVPRNLISPLNRTLLSVQIDTSVFENHHHHQFSPTTAFSPMVLYYSTIYLHFFFL